jgi:hypothetical protein
MRITGSGNNVGIGTATPSSRLDVADATSAIITLTRTDSTAGNGVIRSIGNTGVTNASINLGGGVNNNMVFTTNGSERMRIDSSGNLLLGTNTSYTSTTTAGGMALVGYGVYPYTTQTGAANSSNLSSLTVVPAVAATGSTSITLSAGQFSPALSNDGTGGSNTASLLGISSNPVITSSGSTARVSLTSIQGIVNRGNAADTSTNASNALTGGTFNITHGVSLPDTAVSGTAYGLSGSIINASGTMTAATAVRAQINLGSSTNFKTNSTPTAAGFELGAFAVGAPTAVGNATVTNGYGIKLAGPTVGVTGTMTNYYAFRADAPSVSGTLTNRYGIWMDDSLSTNYFAGNVGIGTSSPVSIGGHSGILTVYGSNATGIVFGNSTGTNTYITRTNSDLNFRNLSSTGSQTWSTQDTERMRIDSSGNLGIGTSSPGARLHLLQAGGARARFGDSQNTVAIGSIEEASDSAIGFFTQTSTERMRISSAGNLGLGVTPSSWGNSKSLTLNTGAFISGGSNGYRAHFGSNAYESADNVWRYVAAINATRYTQIDGQHQWFNAPSGTGGNVISFTQAMTLDASGNLGIGNTAPDSRLRVLGATSGTGPASLRIGFNSTSVNYFDADTQYFRKGDNTNTVIIDSSSNVQTLAGAQVVWAPAPAAISTTATLTNANIQGQIINTTGTSYTVTMPLGTTMETLVPWAAVNLGYNFTVINTASGTITMAVNTGVTSLGGLTIATGTSAQFRIRRTAANTFILYRMS